MAVTKYIMPAATGTPAAAQCLMYYYCDTDAEKPVTGLTAGDMAFAKDNNKLYKATGATTWAEVGGGAGGSTLESHADLVSSATAIAI